MEKDHDNNKIGALEIKTQRIRDLENEYLIHCKLSQNSNEAIGAFHKWINEVIVLLRMYCSPDDKDLKWIMDQDYSGSGYQLHDLYSNLSKKYSYLLGEIKSRDFPNLLLNTIPPKTDSIRKKKPLVFISHKSSQIQFVTALVTLLEKCGFTKENLFCSSVVGFQIGLDEDIVETLKAKFVDYDLYVVFVLSTDFFESAFCLNEMGAAWALQVQNSIIITRDMDESKIDGVVSKTKTRVSFKENNIQLKTRMIELRDKLLYFAGLTKVSDVNWVRYYDDFIRNVYQANNEALK